MTQPPKKPPLDWTRLASNPNFSLGFVFLALAVVFFANESMRTFAFVFLPLGIVFFSLALSGTGAGKPKDDAGGEPSDPADPDWPPTPPER